MNWTTIKTGEDVCAAFPELMEELRREISIASPAADAPAACREILQHYRTGNSAAWLRTTPPEPGTETEETADKYADGWFNKKQFWHKLERDTEGHLRWDTVTEEGGVQFFNNLNRHLMMAHLFTVYRQTGNPKYIRALNRHFLDWFTFTSARGELDYGKQMQVALRVPIWARIFYGTLEDPNVDEALHLLMLAHVPAQARHLIANPLQNNGLTMTINGLLHAALGWPEFRDAKEWERIGADRLSGVTKNLIYPDGAATELTSTYHGVTRGMIDSAAKTLLQAGRELPAGMAEKLTLAYGYTPNVMRPDGAMPLNNDSDRGYHTKTALAAAERFDRPDWAYIATNGEQGEAPSPPPSRVYPWAGHVVSRSDWSRDAHWSFFDIGPWGTGHQHNDKLHLSVHAHGRDLLVDAGRFWYEGGPIRTYALSGAAHNGVLLDGFGQVPGRPRASAPASLISLQDDVDFALGRFDRGFGFVDAERTRLVSRHGSHTRALVYLRDRCWLVVDRIESEDAAAFSTLWHFHPDCTVETEGNTVRTTDHGVGNLEIRPIAGPRCWELSLVKGREKPTPQGWYSEESYATWHENVCAVCEVPLEGGAVLSAWLLTPGAGAIPSVESTVLHCAGSALQVSLEMDDGWRRTVTVNTRGRGCQRLDAHDHRLHGYCSVQAPCEAPRACCGRIETADGTLVHDDMPSPADALAHAADEMHVSTDESTAPLASQHFRVPLHNPLIDEPMRVVAAVDNPSSPLHVSIEPEERVMQPGDTARMDIKVEGPASAPLPEAAPTVTVILTGAEQRAETSLPVPVRPVVEVPIMPATTRAVDLFDRTDISAFHAGNRDQPHGAVRLAWLGDCLAVAAELLDDRCTATAIPSENPPQVELFFDALGGNKPRQVVMSPSGDHEGGSMRLLQFGEPVQAPETQVTMVASEGAVRLAAAIPLRLLGLAPGAAGFLFDAALVSARNGEQPKFVSLFGSNRPFLESCGYAKALLFSHGTSVLAEF